MRTLEEVAIFTLKNTDRSNGMRGYYRYVIPFSFNGIEYVVKIDKYPSFIGLGSCAHEAERWESFKDGEWSDILVPVLESGKISGIFIDENEFNNYGWVVMEKVETLHEYLNTTSAYECRGFMRDTLLPELQTKHPGVEMPHDCIVSVDYDGHSGNWGIYTDGSWRLFDYGGV